MNNDDNQTGDLLWTSVYEFTTSVFFLFSSNVDHLQHKALTETLRNAKSKVPLGIFLTE